MTGRVDNQIGRAVIPAGYDHAGRARALIHDDSPAVRMAVTTAHQLDLACEHLPPDRTRVVRFESVLATPDLVTDDLSQWLQRKRGRQLLSTVVDLDRARSPALAYPPGVVAEVRAFLQPLRQRLGYTGD